MTWLYVSIALVVGFVLGAWVGSRSWRRERSIRRDFVDEVRQLKDQLHNGAITVNEWKRLRREAETDYYRELAMIGMDVTP